MGYTAKTLSIGDQIGVMLEGDADREEVASRLALDGVRLKVIQVTNDAVRVGVRGPAGLTPKRLGELVLSQGALSLTRSADTEIVVTLKPGANAAAAMDWLASEGICFRLAAIRGRYCVFTVRACRELLILRDELTDQQSPPAPKPATP